MSEPPTTDDFPTPSHDDWERAAEKALSGQQLESIAWRTEDGSAAPPLLRAAPGSDVPSREGDVRTCTSVLAPDADTEEVVDAVLHQREHGFDLIRVGRLDAVASLARSGSVGDLLVALQSEDGLDVQAVEAAAAGHVAGVVSGTAYDQCTPVEQLALVLWHAYGHVFRPGAEQGAPDPAVVAEHLWIELPVDQLVVQEVAKLRALRELWRRALGLHGVPASTADAMRVLAMQSGYTQTRFEPATNLIRGTLSGFAAIAGGADAVELAVYDERANGAGDCGGVTLALNQVHLMLDESGLGHVRDPLGGAPMVESLTSRLTESAWELFEGLRDARCEWRHFDDKMAGVLGLDDSSLRRQSEFLARRRVLVGIGRFAQPADDDDIPPEPDGEIVYGAADVSYEERLDLLTMYAAEPFEWLRDRVLAHVADGGRRPSALVVAAGDARTMRAQSGFAADFLRGGGFDVEAPAPVATPEEAAAVLTDRVFDALVVCGDDAVTAALEAATDMPYYRVGRDGTDSDRLIARMFEGVDAVELLADALDRIGVPRTPAADVHEDVDDEQRLADIARLGEWD